MRNSINKHHSENCGSAFAVPQEAEGPGPPAHPNVRGETESLIHAYTVRASTRQLPVEAQRRQEQVLPERLERIQRATEQEDATNQPFTLSEPKKAGKKGKESRSHEYHAEKHGPGW